MRRQTSERSDDISPYLMVACVQVAVRKFPERLPTAWAYLIKLFFLSLCIRVCWCVYALRFIPNATNAQLISTLAASVEASYLHLHSPLLASKAVLSSWSLVVINMCSTCQGEVPAETGITGWYQLVPRPIYVRVYFGMKRYQVHLYHTHEYINAYVPFVTYVWRTCFCCCCTHFLDRGVDDFVHLLFTLYTQTDTRYTRIILYYTSTSLRTQRMVDNQINVVGGWCCCTHFFGVNTNAGTKNK